MKVSSTISFLDEDLHEFFVIVGSFKVYGAIGLEEGMELLGVKRAVGILLVVAIGDEFQERETGP